VLLGLEGERIHVDRVLVGSVLNVRDRECNCLTCAVLDSRLTHLVGSGETVARAERRNDHSRRKVRCKGKECTLVDNAAATRSARNRQEIT